MIYIYMYKRHNEYDYRYVKIYVHTCAKERIRETEKTIVGAKYIIQ